jgi:RimJ/RimL family protein N-acetyltransferase
MGGSPWVACGALAGKAAPMPPPLTLEGPRLRLRPWQEADRDPLAAMNADPAVMRHFPAPLSRAESDAWGARLQAHIDAHGWGFWAVELRARPGCVGAVGLMHIPWPIPWEATFTPTVEIGWRIASGLQRQGLAEEAARLALAAGFGPIGLEAIVAFTVLANEPSWRLMEKLGMSRIGVFEHPRLPQGHPLRPHLLYRLQRDEYGAVR